MMFREFFIVSNFVNKLLFRNIKKIYDKYKFYTLVFSLIFIILLLLFSVVLKDSVSGLFSAYVTGGSTTNIFSLMKAVGINTSIIISIFYFLLKMLSPEEDNVEKMLSNYGVSYWIRNLSINLSKYTWIIIGCDLILLSLYYPAVLESLLTTGFKITFLVYIVIQTIFYIICLDIVYNFSTYVFYKIGISYYRQITNYLLVGISIYIFSKIFGNANHIYSIDFDYNITYFCSPIFLLFSAELRNVVEINSITYICMLFSICIIFILSNLVKIKDKNCKRASRLSNKIPFLLNEKAIITKEIIEYFRNSDNISSFVCSILILIVLKQVVHYSFDSMYVAEAILAIPTVSLFYSFGNEPSMKYIYKAVLKDSYKMLIYKYIAGLVLVFLQCFIISLFFRSDMILSNIDIIILCTLVSTSVFSFLGTVFPYSRKSTFGSTAVICAIILFLIPLVMISIYYVQLYTISITLVKIALLVVWVLLQSLAIWLQNCKLFKEENL
ncbi:hypothetical protein CFOLD11_09110 [Clostridium folliculivorans]|uniref:Uncharacterized protein n=1 Tax=Clostridium folliculivorans TaxID=2886038 RepID=A0A9W5Y017_9CLOT|nr:hypothetical protein [Clostridium folliculivorans]GKU24085.1 hypothetical protein CFOLD11_09110 [Clostridium folliculivorans]